MKIFLKWLSSLKIKNTSDVLKPVIVIHNQNYIALSLWDCCVWIPGDPQFLKYSNEPVWQPTTILQLLKSHFFPIWWLIWKFTETVHLYLQNFELLPHDWLIVQLHEWVGVPQKWCIRIQIHCSEWTDNMLEADTIQTRTWGGPSFIPFFIQRTLLSHGWVLRYYAHGTKKNHIH